MLQRLERLPVLADDDARVAFELDRHLMPIRGSDLRARSRSEGVTMRCVISRARRSAGSHALFIRALGSILVFRLAAVSRL